MHLYIHRSILAIGTTALFLALGACSDQPNAPGNQIGQGARQMASGIADYSTDVYLTSKVKARLAANTGLDSFDISVETVNGVVTLTGAVDSEATREIAGNVARNTSGVKDVDNKLRIGTDSKEE